ncbi:hypothetical protein BGZ46_009579 [Entomortierella lignicola]|nr:hypothetical protein BGZ46_009579 [Entomortierella lignicola]
MEKIVYKSPNNLGRHMPDVFVLAEPGMAAKYRFAKSPSNPVYGKGPDENQKSLALVDVVQSFDVFQTETGKGFEGKVHRPAKADLEALFNTEDQQKIVEQIVLHGEIQGAQNSG